MAVTVGRRQNLNPHKVDFRYGNISVNSHTKKYGNILKRMGVRWNDCEKNERRSRNRLRPDGGILPLSSRHPFQINGRSDDQVINLLKLQEHRLVHFSWKGTEGKYNSRQELRSIELRHPHHPVNIIPCSPYTSHICSVAELHLRALPSVRSVPITRHTAGTTERVALS
jgi:hypothetical protein